MYPSPHYVQLIVRWDRCTWERSHNQRLLSYRNISDHVGERCHHVPFCLIITGVAVHVRKVAHPKYSKMVI